MFIMMKIFIDRLRELIGSNSITKIGNESGVSVSTLSLYLSGKRKPIIDNIIKLSQYFNVSADYLLGLSDDPLGGAPEHIKKELKELKECKKELENFRSMFLQVEKVFNHFKKTYEEQKNDSE